MDGYNNGNMSQNNDIFIFGLQEKNNRYAGVPSIFTRNVSHTNTTYKKVPLPTLLTQAQLEILLAWLEIESESWRLDIYESLTSKNQILYTPIRFPSLHRYSYRLAFAPTSPTVVCLTNATSPAPSIMHLNAPL